MSKKVTVLTIEGLNPKRFADTLCGYVKTQKEESEGIISDFVGSIDEENGRFDIARKASGGSRMNFEASLHGSFAPSKDKKSLVVEYYTNASALYIASFIIVSILFAGALTMTLLQYFLGAEKIQTFFTLSFGFAFLILLPNAIFKFDIRSLNKIMNTIVTEYATTMERDERLDAQQTYRVTTDENDMTAAETAAPVSESEDEK